MVILFFVVFFLGFVADPLVGLYVDPWSYLTPWASSRSEYYYEDDEPSGWIEHFIKGFTGMGVIGFLKVIIASNFSYFRLGGGRGRNTGRDRYEQVSWIIILIGVSTFLVVCFLLPDLKKISNHHRQYGRAFEPGVVAHSKKQENESWTFRAMMMMTTTKIHLGTATDIPPNAILVRS